MGVDVTLYAKGEVSPEELTLAKKYIRDRIPDFLTGSVFDNDFEKYLVFNVYGEEKNMIELSTLSRYYGPGYERGHWPSIYSAIMAMKGAFPNLSIHYGSDSQDMEEIGEFTELSATKMWDHWLSPKWDDYRESWRRYEKEHSQ